MSVINMAGELIEEDADHLSFNASPQGYIYIMSVINMAGELLEEDADHLSFNVSY